MKQSGGENQTLRALTHEEERKRWSHRVRDYNSEGQRKRKVGGGEEKEVM